jgi:signal transduction histidine kinase
MTSFYNELPLALLLSALVGIFLSLWRDTRTSRFRLWVTGWIFITAHAILRLIPGTGPLSISLVQTLYSAALGVSGLAFLLSFSEIVDRPRWRNAIFAVVGLPLAVFGSLMAFNVQNRWAYFCAAACAYSCGVIGHWIWHKRKTVFVLVFSALLIGLGAHALLRIMAYDFVGSLYSMLLAIYLTSGLLALKSLRRLSPGSVAVAGGFFAWAVTCAVFGFLPRTLTTIGADSELWNVPQVLVAFGMIVLELEDRSKAARRAEQRARNLTRQVSSFAELTSRLLSGVEVSTFCRDIVHEIAEVSNFRRVAILIADDAGRFSVAGSTGLPQNLEVPLRDIVANASIDGLSRVIDRGRRLGAHSVICDMRRSKTYELVKGSRVHESNAPWSDSEYLLVPLRSPVGNVVGCICLDEPKDASLLTAQDMGAIEILASDLGVAIEKASVQRKMLLHEKLASIGQLVSGVAHELNNPLTVIIGYSELLEGTETAGRHARELGIMRREALRMRNIIENLLRFARQSKAQTRSANLVEAVRDAISLRDYDFKRQNITVELDIPDTLPQVLIDEAQLKTVLVNLVSNAHDAILNSEEKKITVFARRIGDRVIVSVVDTGTGFKDINRAFDPFFSTKKIGQGPGLGLSICYGIVKQFGGEIYAQNAVPKGACVTMELAIADQALSQPSVVSR